MIHLLVTAFAMLLGAAPTPTPGRLPPPTSGEIYFVSSGHRTYLDWKRPAGTHATPMRGHITLYDVMAENSTDLPRSFISFTADGPARFQEPVLLAQPTTIDGKPFICPSTAQASTSVFVRKYQVCPSLPAAMLHQTVRVDVYEMRYPDGGTAYVTDNIETK